LIIATNCIKVDYVLWVASTACAFDRAKPICHEFLLSPIDCLLPGVQFSVCVVSTASARVTNISIFGPPALTEAVGSCYCLAKSPAYVLQPGSSCCCYGQHIFTEDELFGGTVTFNVTAQASNMKGAVAVASKQVSVSPQVEAQASPPSVWCNQISPQGEFCLQPALFVFGRLQVVFGYLRAGPFGYVCMDWYCKHVLQTKHPLQRRSVVDCPRSSVLQTTK
jgi:hypothetical protein